MVQSAEGQVLDLRTVALAGVHTILCEVTAHTQGCWIDFLTEAEPS